MTLGSRWTSRGRPSASFSPWSSTVTRSEIPMRNFMSCSMTTMRQPLGAGCAAPARAALAVSCGFMPAVGSSSRTTLGSVARARAISSRRMSP